MFNWDRWNTSCNSFGDPPDITCVLNKTEDVNLNIFNMITTTTTTTTTTKSETLTKYISCNCECKFDCRKCNSNQK